MKRKLQTVGALASAGVAAGLAIPLPAGAAVASFQWTDASVTVTTGTCHQQDCQWRLSVDVPATGQFLGLAGPTMVSGDQLTVAIPPICGVVQADLEHLNLHGAWEVEVGHVRTFSTCQPESTTTTTTTQAPVVTTTTTVPPIVTQPPASVPPAPTSTLPAPQVLVEGPVTSHPSTTVAPVPVVSPVPTGQPLPMTGVNWRPLGVLGSALISLALWIMPKRRTI